MVLLGVGGDGLVGYLGPAGLPLPREDLIDDGLLIIAVPLGNGVEFRVVKE